MLFRSFCYLKQQESEERNRLFAETVDPYEDRQTWKEAFGFIPQLQPIQLSRPHQSVNAHPPLSTDLSTLGPQATPSSTEASSTGP